VSLVLEALRRVERADDRPMPLGITVTGIDRRVPWRSRAIPLALGLLTGGLFVFLFSPPRIVPVGARPAEPVAVPRFPKGRAGLPPPLFAVVDPAAHATSKRADGAVALDTNEARRPSRRAPSVLPAPSPQSSPSPLVLQAVGERDARAIAVINDQLVTIGDVVGRARVTRIAPDFVEVAHPDGRIETVRFAPPPPDPSPSPEPTARP